MHPALSLLVLSALRVAVSRAEAATVAVVDFQSWGASQEETDAVTEGVRAALASAGALESIAGSDIAAGVSAASEAELREARERASEARRLYLAGDFPGAISAATLAVSAHGAALSEVGRRSEVADAWFTLGVACARSGLGANAVEAFEHVARLYPRYLEDRATNVPAGARAMLQAAEDNAGHPQLPRAQVGAAMTSLDVDWVVTGSLDAAGGIEVQLWGPDRGEGEGEIRLVAALHDYETVMPPLEQSETWRAIAADIAGRAVVTTREPEDRGDDRPEAARYTGGDDRVTDRWWFWTAAAAGVGGGVLIGYAIWDPAPVAVAGPETWSVRVSGL